MTTTDHKKQVSDLLETVIKEGASDLHLSEGKQPVLRVSGFLIPLLKHKQLTREDLEGITDALLTPENKKLFSDTKEVDFSFSFNPEARFRGNCFYQRGVVSVALRLIPRKIKTIAELNLPPILEMFTEKNQGFFLVVGAVGQGKSTTLAAMIEMINQTRTEHIITIEDPIEYIFEDKKSIIDQREVKIDTKDFHTGLTNIFRQDVDVIMIGEMRDAETIGAAVTAAETGHMVFSTLHTNTASQTIDRIIDSFPPNQQDQIRIQLAASLSGILSQRLIPRIAGGLVPAYELLISRPSVSNLIRDKRIHEVDSIIETGSEQGMINMNRCLVDLVRRGEITVENAMAYSNNPDTLGRML